MEQKTNKLGFKYVLGHFPFTISPSLLPLHHFPCTSSPSPFLFTFPPFTFSTSRNLLPHQLHPLLWSPGRLSLSLSLSLLSLLMLSLSSLSTSLLSSFPFPFHLCPTLPHLLLLHWSPLSIAPAADLSALHSFPSFSFPCFSCLFQNFIAIDPSSI